jgi:hypothetical protein
MMIKKALFKILSMFLDVIVNLNAEYLTLHEIPTFWTN